MILPLAGPAFPFRIAGGGVARATGSEKLAMTLRHLLLTRTGERLMRRDYGGGVENAVHEPNDAALAGLVRHELARALATHAPQVELVSAVEVRAVDDRLEVAFDWRAAGTGGVERLRLIV